MSLKNTMIYELRKILMENLNDLPSLFYVITDGCTFDLETLREFRDYVDWDAVREDDIIDRFIDDENVLNAMREFRNELKWEEDGFRRWYEELTWGITL